MIVLPWTDIIYPINNQHRKVGQLAENHRGVTIKLNIFSVYSFSLLAFMPCFKGAKKTNQQRSGGSEAAKERAANHSPFHCWSRIAGLPEVYTPSESIAYLRGAPRNGREFENSDTM